jgi:uncharacterized protein (TIRG00374 family)
MKQKWYLVISLCLTAIIGWILYRSVPDWHQAGLVMISGNLFWILAGLGFISLHMLLRSLRWRLLLIPVKKKIPVKNLLSMTLIKYVINLIPPRMGEIAASILLARKEKLPASTVIASSMFERILDFLAVTILFIFYLVFFAGKYIPPSKTGQEIFDMIRFSAIAGFCTVTIAIIVLIPFLRSHRWHHRIPEMIRKHVLFFLDGFRAMQNRATAGKIIALSLLIWVTICAQLWCLVRAYIDSFPMTGTFLILAVTVVGVSIPTPGGVGGYQYLMSLSLIQFFRSFLSKFDAESQAAGISNGTYVFSMVPVILIGLFLLHREGFTLGRAAKLSSEQTETTRG